ncbi:hypothetical protein L2E82_17398 [Cichorium intybus]|uniref:Uncharacterized protein n=1 Tax=Cichorium intybus TaxID=13427 RepID=A0ACB9F7H5_CICIN|nr:hypothetical protein L2E82_17398 [Cichorium intybus]
MPRSLESHLSNKTISLYWKTLTRIISEITNALLFLHTSQPGEVLHGKLKPENILLNSELSCKLWNFRFSPPVNEETFRCHSFRQYEERSGPFSFTDPESTGLINEVRKVVSGSNLASILDPSAGEWSSFVAKWLADLGLQCCESDVRDRPVILPLLVKELEQLSLLEDRRIPSFFLCPILKVSVLL